MMLEAGLILFRFLHYASTTFLFGATLYPLYGFGMEIPRVFADKVWRWLLPASLLALISLIGWFEFSAANMAGNASAMFDMPVLLIIIKTMSFGKLWLGRLAVSVLLVVLSLRRPNEVLFRWQSVLSGLLMVSLVGTGHAQEPAQPYMAVHYVADGAHLLAAGAWLGALWPLAMALRAAPPLTSKLLVRFSWMGQIAVGVLLISGLVNSWFLVGSFGSLFGTFYGRLLCLKILLFGAMLGLAAMNRFWITPQYAATTQDYTLLDNRLRRHILAEQLFGLLVLGVVSWLGTLQPPIAGLSI